jgi:hypothetical protein
MRLLETSATAPVQHPVTLTLTDKAQIVYDALREVAKKVADSRGYCAAVSVVHFFVPGEVVANALCMARSTLYLKLAELKAAELVEARAHYTTYKGRTRADGMVWAIKMRPERPGAIRVPYDALKKSYRCLSADIADGRTVFREIGQSKETSTRQVDIQKILAWALPPSTTQKPDKGLTVRPDLEKILDVPFVNKEAGSAAVDGAAQALAMSLGDAGGLMFYRWLLWQLLRRYNATGEDYSYQVYLMAQRAKVDVLEGFSRKGGAVFVSRLKQADFYEWVMNAPPVRVGIRPN